MFKKSFLITALFFVSAAFAEEKKEAQRNPAASVQITQLSSFDATARATGYRGNVFKVVDADENVVCYLAGTYSSDGGISIHCLPRSPKPSKAE
jgi:hypothetical protein